MRRTSAWTLALVAALVVGLVGAAPATAVTGYTVTVKVVTPSGTGIPDIRLDLSQSSSSVGSSTTDGAGQAKLADVPAGAYTVTGKARIGTKSKAISENVTVGSANVHITVTVAGVQAVTGKVTDKVTAAPIVGARLTLSSTSGAGQVAASTDSNGRYVALAPASTYRVHVTSHDPDATYTYRTAYYPGTPYYGEASDVRLAPGKDATGIDTKLTKNGKVTGTVTSHGKAVPGAPLELTGTTAWVGTGKTTTSGAYAVHAVPGTFTVSVSPGSTGTFLRTYYGNTVRGIDATAVKVTSAKTASGVDIAATSGASLKGVVKNTKGKPVGGVWVYGENVDRAGFSSALTDVTGAYVLRGLATGKVQVSAEASGTRGLVTASATQGTTSSAKTLVLRSVGTATISGTVAVKNGKIARAGVTLLTSKKVQVAHAYPSSKGKVSFSHLPAGTYLVALDGANVAKTVTLTSAKKVSFGTLTRGKQSVVKGTVRSPSGKAVTGVNVSVVDAYGTRVGGTVTSSKGTYSIKGIVKGRYTVQASDDAQRRYATVRASATAKAGKGVTKSLTLKTAATLKGVVKNAAGKPVAGLDVWAGDSYATTSSKGAYTLKGLPAGTTSVRFTDSYTGGYRNASKAVTAKAGKTVTVATVTVK